MSWNVSGSCNQCGECCKIEIHQWHFLADEKTGTCKYLDKSGKIYNCLITDGVFTEDTPKKPEVPQEDYDFWKRECLPYPDPNRRAHTPDANGYQLPEKCGFNMEET